MTDARPESWIVLHTRSETYDPDQLLTRYYIAPTASDAFDAICAMACITKQQRTEKGFFYPAMDTHELAVALNDLTGGDDFEAMLAEEFNERVERHELPAALRIENLVQLDEKAERRTAEQQAHAALKAMMLTETRGDQFELGLPPSQRRSWGKRRVIRQGERLDRATEQRLRDFIAPRGNGPRSGAEIVILEETPAFRQFQALQRAIGNSRPIQFREIR